MKKEAKHAVRQVLKEAAQHEHFFDFSDGERLNWMITRAFHIGKEQRHVASNLGCGGENPHSGELKDKRSNRMRKQRRQVGRREAS